MGHGEELVLFAFPETLQALGQVVQLVHIDRRTFQPLQDRVLAFQLDDAAVLGENVPYAKLFQHFYRSVIILFGDGEGDGKLPVLRVDIRSEHSFHHHVRALPMFMTSGPYRAMTAALRISSRVSSLTSSGSASSSEVAPSVPELRPFAAR